MCKNFGYRTDSSWAENCDSSDHGEGLSLSSFDLTQISELWESALGRTSSWDTFLPKFFVVVG